MSGRGQPSLTRARIADSPLVPIVVAQLFGTSLWFSANSAADDLMLAWGMTLADIGTLTNAVQIGFITGTLIFSITGLADRFPASRIFSVCAITGAALNASFVFFAQGLAGGMLIRFLVGLCLAGIYPLGMKLVVSWMPDKAGAALAWLVGMLTLGISLPHGFRALGGGLPWQWPLLLASALAALAACMIHALGDGPHLKRVQHGVKWGDVFRTFSIPAFRASALGYFGHQWELYAFWALIPALLSLMQMAQPASAAQSMSAFVIIGVGAAGCVLGGVLSRRIGSARVAALALAGSVVCCALFPFAVGWPLWCKWLLLLVWSVSAIADSPHYSALSAKACPPQMVGSALAFQNAVGFAITVVSIQLGMKWVGDMGVHVAWFLLPGPLLGLVGLRRLL